MKRSRKLPHPGVRIPVHVDAAGDLDRGHPLLELVLARVERLGVVPVIVAASQCAEWRVGDEALVLTDVRRAPRGWGWVVDQQAPDQHQEKSR